MDIVIADHHDLIRSGLNTLLSQQNDMHIVATASDGLEAYQAVERWQPDILIMDIHMPKENGLLTVTKIRNDFPTTKILVLTNDKEKISFIKLLKRGISGYLHKDISEKELLKALRTIHAGGTYINPQMTTVFVNEFVKNSPCENINDPYEKLSKREMEILLLIVKGYGNKEIAQKWNVSVKTIEATKTNMMEKLQIKTRPALVEYALKKKLLTY